MADYKIEVTEYHVVNKTYWVEAQNQKEARSKAKQRDWYNASGDDYTGDEAAEEIMRMLNTQVGRTAFTTVPNLVNGTGWGSVLQSELGTYNTKEIKERKENIRENISPFLPNRIAKLITPKKISDARNKSWSNYWKGKSPKRELYSEEEVIAIIKSLQGGK